MFLSFQFPFVEGTNEFTEFQLELTILTEGRRVNSLHLKHLQQKLRQFFLNSCEYQNVFTRKTNKNSRALSRLNMVKP